MGVEDGRVFVGRFHCLDNQGNVILYDTLELSYVTGPSSGAAVVEERAPPAGRGAAELGSCSHSVSMTHLMLCQVLNP